MNAPLTQAAVFAYFNQKFEQDKTMADYVDSSNVLKLTEMGEEILNLYDVAEGDAIEESVFEWVFFWSDQPKIRPLFNE